MPNVRMKGKDAKDPELSIRPHLPPSGIALTQDWVHGLTYHRVAFAPDRTLLSDFEQEQKILGKHEEQMFAAVMMKQCCIQVISSLAHRKNWSLAQKALLKHERMASGRNSQALTLPNSVRQQHSCSEHMLFAGKQAREHCGYQAKTVRC